MEGIDLLARCFHLETPGVRATAPMLRGVWGAALYDLDQCVYQTVFESEGPQASTLVPGYILRPSPPDPQCAPAVDYLLIGAAVQHDAVLLRARDIASGMGLGPDRHRFHIRQEFMLAPDGTAHRPTDSPMPWVS